MTLSESASSSDRCRVTTTAATAPGLSGGRSGTVVMSLSVDCCRGLDAEALGRFRVDVLERVPPLVGGEDVTKRTLHSHPALVHPDRRRAQLQEQVIGV